MKHLEEKKLERERERERDVCLASLLATEVNSEEQASLHARIHFQEPVAALS